MTDCPPRPNFPRLLACGYREIRIVKSGLTFPTFLVSFPGDCHPVWRSKRDFLLLGRETAKPEVLFPKAALKKLADKFPWKRPGVSLPFVESDVYHVTMKKSIQQVDQFLAAVNQQAAESPGSPIYQQWQIFCRQEDTEGLVPLSSKSGKDGEGDFSKVQKSSQLGQYFCTRENAKQVVHKALSSINSQTWSDDTVHFCFLEPSCGHGDVVESLVEALHERQVPPGRVSIHAVDIDSDAISECKGKELPFPEYSVCWSSRNFLETAREPSPDNTVVVCVGGPPYSAGAGNCQDMQRDLPTKFVLHCLQEWQAAVIVFLLPERYRDTTFVMPQHVRRETIDLGSSTFFFQGTAKVTQPSILQCYTRSNMNK
eukprot:Nitzschia sp. Nitz4//scaffold13_size275219//140580//141689//NITZ4_000876-RA/size275219-exonerate_est2genome-gene-0.186-mRNA-1//1//CDS//3329536020//1612//frame0